MNKTDIKNSLNNIKPDVYAETRIKANIESKECVSFKKIVLSFVSCFTAFVLIFGVCFINAKPTPPTAKKNIVPAKKGGFIIMASAMDSENNVYYQELDIDTSYIHQIFLKTVDVSGFSFDEREKAFDNLKDEMKNIVKCSPLNKSSGTIGHICGEYEGVLIAESSLNYLKLNIDKPNEVQEIVVTNTSEYGTINYQGSDSNVIIYEGRRDPLPLTIAGEQFDYDSHWFWWRGTNSLYEKLADDLNTPYSTFNDSVTFTVKYKNGEIFTSTLDLKFNPDGTSTISLIK